MSGMLRRTAVGALVVGLVIGLTGVAGAQEMDAAADQDDLHGGWIVFEDGVTLAAALENAKDQGLLDTLASDHEAASAFTSSLVESGWVSSAIDSRAVQAEAQLALHKNATRPATGDRVTISIDLPPVQVPGDLTGLGGFGDFYGTESVVNSYTYIDERAFGLAHYHYINGNPVVVDRVEWSDYVKSVLNGFQVKHWVILDDAYKTPKFRLISGWQHKLFDNFGTGLQLVDDANMSSTAGYIPYYYNYATMYDASSFSEWERRPQFHFQYDVLAVAYDGHSFGTTMTHRLYNTLPGAACYDDNPPYADGCLWR
jgi:hypothetical protein